MIRLLDGTVGEVGQTRVSAASFRARTYRAADGRELTGPSAILFWQDAAESREIVGDGSEIERDGQRLRVRVVPGAYPERGLVELEPIPG